MTCKLMAPLPGERPANVIQALSRVTWGTDYTKMLAEGTEADGMLVLDSAEVSNESMQTAFALAAKAHAQGWAVKRKSNISSGEDIITFQPPRGLIAPR